MPCGYLARCVGFTVSDKDENPNTIEGLAGEPAGAEQANGEVSPAQALAAKEEECKALNDKYMRLAAEFENYKRLSQRDQREQVRYGNEQLVKELLPVVDNLERAIKAARDSTGSGALVQGVELTLKQLTGTLSKFGVQTIDSVGQPFDPAAHQAVTQIASDTVPAQHVAEEYQRGYRLHDRTIRAAMVAVSSGPSPSNGEETSA
ncbi:Protein GrpE [Nitrospira moscoviensis]|uniref:Protein GrpE n=1 Tax=Nitrospira moscoviensis TaxID=42253 RepID=A0A0K2GD65_NITMO|nr:Protein GrpE [Nitrospira moscoviensis]